MDHNIYESGKYTVLDFEVIARDGRFGSPVNPNNSLFCGVWRTPDGKYQYSAGDEFSHERLLGDIARSDYIVAHHAKYELGWLMRCGLDIKNIVVFDTMLAEYVLLGNLAATDKDTGLPGLSISLDACLRRRGVRGKDKIVSTYLDHGITVDQIPEKWIKDRCISDVASTHKLFLDQRSALRDTNRLPVLFTRCILTPVLAEIEPNGMCLDKERVNKTYVEYKEKLKALEQKMEVASGGINWRSTKQTAEFIYGKLGFDELRRKNGSPLRTAGGKARTDQKTLAKLHATTDVQRTFIALKKDIGKVSSALSKNLDYFKGVCDEQDGIFKAEFNQARTATHRLSSSGIPSSHGSVQFQNLPRAFKPLFRARRAGHRIVEVDGSQLEFRIAAFLGQDKQAIRDILDPSWDAHVTSAAAMANVSYDTLYAEYRSGDKHAVAKRQAAKEETFKPLYGGSKGTKAQERWYKAFRERYPELNKVQDDWVAEVLSTKQLITPWGLRYYWPRATVNNYGYVNVKASVYNYPVQALATAEIIPVALVSLRNRLSVLGVPDVLLVNTVHDSIIAEIAPESIDIFKEQAILAFTTDCYDYLERVYGLKMNVPLGCAIKIGEHWGEGNEESYNVYADGRREKLA